MINIDVMEGSRSRSGPEIKIRSERDRESTSEAVKQPTQARPGQAELALQPAQSAS